VAATKATVAETKTVEKIDDFMSKSYLKDKCIN
jgi:hypothetical protein